MFTIVGAPEAAVYTPEPAALLWERMGILRGALRVLLIWMLSGLAAPFVSRGFARLARRMPSGSFLEATLLELSTSASATLVNVLAEVLTGLAIESVEFVFALAAALRLRPAPGSSIVKR
jgi:ABC-type sulfate transport system permease component